MAKADPIGFLMQPNTLINNEAPPRACITDFGLCSITSSGSFGPTRTTAGSSFVPTRTARGDTIVSTRTTAGGTPGYMASELFDRGARVSKEADMYAFGMLVYEVITGSRPFGHHRVCDLSMLTTRGSRPPRPEDPVAVGFGQEMWDFVEKCWDNNPKLRPSATEVLDHFRRAAMTSTDVDPGPTVPIREPPDTRPESSFIKLCECNGPSVFPF